MSTAEKEGDEPSSLELFQRAMRLIREDGYSALVWKILWKLPALRSLVVWRFAVATRNIVTLEDALEFAFSRRFGALITPVQIRSEIQALCKIVLENRARTVLEIGTERGGTLFLFSRAAAPDAFLVSVDLPRQKLKAWRELCTFLGKMGQSVSILDGDSHVSSTVERVRQVLGGRKVDFLFIDADHSYEGVRQDFENYTPFLNDPSIIAFHDINPDYWTKFAKRTGAWAGEVCRFWAEVKMKYPHEELIDNPDEDGFGIGILFVGSNAKKTPTDSHHPEFHTYSHQP